MFLSITNSFSQWLHRCRLVEKFKRHGSFCSTINFYIVYHLCSIVIKNKFRTVCKWFSWRNGRSKLGLVHKIELLLKATNPHYIPLPAAVQRLIASSQTAGHDSQSVSLRKAKYEFQCNAGVINSFINGRKCFFNQAVRINKQSRL